jgi:hypothetical protein
MQEMLRKLQYVSLTKQLRGIKLCNLLKHLSNETRVASYMVIFPV